MSQHEQSTTAIAAAAVASPAWLPPLHEVSVFFAELLPILGALWIILQILMKILEAYRGKRK